MEELLTPEEVADLLKVKSKTVLKWLREGTMVGLKIGGIWRVKKSVLGQMLEVTFPAEEGVRHLYRTAQIDSSCKDFMKDAVAHCGGATDATISKIEEVFMNEGWDGHDGIQLIWIPSFFDFTPDGGLGFLVWHVQSRDGMSWLISRRKLISRRLVYHGHICL